jgi:CheY-like chemotaxis protein
MPTGLAICHGIVTSLGGTLSVESELGQGSIFRVSLPAAVRTIGANAAARAQHVAHAAAVPNKRGHILVVDDEPIVCFSLERLLSSEGEVAAETSAKGALARIKAGERFDVILCDLLMPEMDAPAVYEELRKIDPGQAEKMVFVTGGAFTVRARDFLSRVPNERLSKPFDVEALRALVRSRIS